MTFEFDIERTAAGAIRMAVVIHNDVIWPHPERDDGASDFDPEDVLSYLTDAWSSLLLAQSWPIAFEAYDEPNSVTGLLRAAEDRWERLEAADAADVDGEAALVDEFLYKHDFSQMKHGAGLRSCFVLRQQARVRIETNDEVHEDITFGEFVNQLDRLGSIAAEILQRRTDASAVRVIERWHRRDQTDTISAAALVSGIPREDVEKSDDLRAILIQAVADRSVSAIANDNSSPVFAAARSSGPLGPASLIEVLRAIQSIPNGDVTQVVTLRRGIQRDLRGIDHPLDQGVRAANAMRDWLHQSDDQPVDLEILSTKLGILVKRPSIPDSRLDGIASAGPSHGPAILLNVNTRRQGGSPEDLERSLRFTWAHEIGHLLLDQTEWPALVDAARQRVSRSVETRANAFAAYLLLPPAVAYRRWEQDGLPSGWPALEASLNRLTQQFGIPRIAASRQLARGAPPERRRPLENIFRTNIPNFDGANR